MACSSDACDASSRKADAPAEASNRNAISAAQPARSARASVAENAVANPQPPPQPPPTLTRSPSVHPRARQHRQNENKSMIELWDEPTDIQPASSASEQIGDLSCEVLQSSISEIHTADLRLILRPDSAASEQIQNVSHEDKPAGNISLAEESNSPVKDPEPSAELVMHRLWLAPLASQDVDAPACDASCRNADDASVRKAGAPAQTSNRNASSAAQPAKDARASVAEKCC